MARKRQAVGSPVGLTTYQPLDWNDVQWRSPEPGFFMLYFSQTERGTEGHTDEVAEGALADYDENDRLVALDFLSEKRLGFSLPDNAASQAAKPDLLLRPFYDPAKDIYDVFLNGATFPTRLTKTDDPDLFFYVDAQDRVIGVRVMHACERVLKKPLAA